MRLSDDFYLQDALKSAQNLLGKVLVRKIGELELRVRIVETEAYCGIQDKASHAYNNKRSKRTEPMFNKGGIAYIYLIYGLYHLFNVVVGREGDPQAVLIRAVEPLNSFELIKENRKIKSDNLEALTNGPGKLTEALEIDKSFNAYNLVNGEEIYIEVDQKDSGFEIAAAKRINIDYAEEYKDKNWRFYIKDNTFVSKK